MLSRHAICVPQAPQDEGGVHERAPFRQARGDDVQEASERERRRNDDDGEGDVHLTTGIGSRDRRLYRQSSVQGGRASLRSPLRLVVVADDGQPSAPSGERRVAADVPGRVDA